MAPYIPEEVNVFSVPHSRMKELVNSYFSLIQSTNFTSIVDMSLMLESLYKTFTEFKTHEQIENQLIMRKLQAKMRQLAKQNPAVCNCHKGSKLTKMMHLVKDGFKNSTVQDCVNYGIKLTKELEEFTRSFLPHMQEEEEVFLPLLLEYFTYEELCQLKQTVIQQHFEAQEQEVEKRIWFDRTNEFLENATATNSDDEEDLQANSIEHVTIHSLPFELILGIFDLLSVQDRCRCAQVCKTWNSYSKSQRFWKIITPVQWADGIWNGDDTDTLPSTDFAHAEREFRISQALRQHILPSYGSCVRKLILRGSNIVNDSMLRDMLKFCRNVQHLDVSYCGITDEGLGSLCEQPLTTLVLSGCINVTDIFLMRYFVHCHHSVKISLLDIINKGCASSCRKPNCTEFTARCREFSSRNNTAKLCKSGSAHCLRGTKTEASSDSFMEMALQLNRLDLINHRTEEMFMNDYKRCRTQQLDSANKYKQSADIHPLQYLDMSGCWQITDESLLAVSQKVVFASLRHVDFSGCFQLTAAGLNAFVGVCPSLEPSSLYYCDNIIDGPHSTVASGCRNLECDERVCCRTGS